MPGIVHSRVSGHEKALICFENSDAVRMPYSLQFLTTEGMSSCSEITMPWCRMHTSNGIQNNYSSVNRTIKKCSPLHSSRLWKMTPAGTHKDQHARMHATRTANHEKSSEVMDRTIYSGHLDGRVISDQQTTTAVCACSSCAATNSKTRLGLNLSM